LPGFLKFNNKVKGLRLWGHHTFSAQLYTEFQVCQYLIFIVLAQNQNWTFWGV